MAYKNKSNIYCLPGSFLALYIFNAFNPNNSLMREALLLLLLTDEESEALRLKNYLREPVRSGGFKAQALWFPSPCSWWGATWRPYAGLAPF